MAKPVDDLLDLDKKIEKSIKLSHKQIVKIARRYGVEIMDALQQTYLFLRLRPQLLDCKPKEMSDALYWMLREYACPAYDAMTRAKSVEDMALALECSADEVLSAPEATPLERWRTKEPQRGVIGTLAKMVTERPSGWKTALRVLSIHLDGTSRSNTEVAKLEGISPRRVRQIVDQAADAAWSMD